VEEGQILDFDRHGREHLRHANQQHPLRSLRGCDLGTLSCPHVLAI
jgi:hypothetical protein